MPVNLPTSVALFLVGLLVFPKTATPQEIDHCPAGSTACVRDLPDAVVAPTYNQGQEIYQYPYGHPPGEGGELIIDSDGTAHIPATVKDIPESVDWGWEPSDLQDVHTPPGPQGYPAQIAEKMMCARNPQQAVAWISGAGGTEDESLINRALTAYDWRGRSDGQVDGVVDWIAQWPQGAWEQQYEYREYEQPRPVARYRFVTTSGHVYAWVRTVKVMGCWFVKTSPPTQPQPSGVDTYDAPTQEDAPSSGVEQAEQNRGLYILWESEETQ